MSQCGGFIAEKWLGKPEPELYSNGITPSQRKVSKIEMLAVANDADCIQYFEMIRIWGGWKLFQELLQTLQTIAVKHNVSISNVATRWILDFPYVGAVIVGARMGVTEHIEDNMMVYGWKLDPRDRSAINQVLERSQRDDIYNQLGDCGGEYRL
jgi:diketogulonate reductase-like aldo/keto reductase